MLKCYKLKC
ncbi:hypothetical protein F383_39284 [Gossypium arboreum]|uniref:Uncharacterized protein n=1 Tax=Gossypium arboreum TaxID=29729 RepID=A0A0B0MLT9_GOSAR|nr:hypothetical protein F383_39284 [Gossypium arboreum]